MRLERPSATNHTLFSEPTLAVRSVRSWLMQLSVLLSLFTSVMFFISAAEVRAQTAQSVQYTQNTPDQTLRSDLKVDPSSLGLSIQVPIAGFPGRAGVGLPITLYYSSKQWRLQYDLSWTDIHQNTYSETHPVYAEHSKSGWSSSLGVPYIEWTNYSQPYVGEGEPYCSGCPDQENGAAEYFNRIYLHMPDGSTHELRLNDNEASSPSFTGVFVAVDGSHIKYDADNQMVYLADGSRYFLGGSSADSYYIDRNGNSLTYHHSTRKWTDALGRELELSLPDTPSAGDYTYNLPSVNGGTVSYTVRWKNLGDSGVFSDSGMAINYMSLQCAGASTPSQTPHLFNNNVTTARNHVCSGAVQFNPVVLYQIVLPNGSSYTFNYNEWGEITKVSYPTGGYERYFYAKIEAMARFEEPYAQANRGVKDRWINPIGSGADVIHWQYASSGFLVTTTAPDGSRTERAIYHDDPSSPGPAFGLSDAKDGMAYEERAFSAGGTMLRRTLTDWATSGATSGGYGIATRDPRPTKEVNIILDPGGDALATTTTMTYDDDLNVISTSRYGFVTLNATTALTVAIGSISTGSLLRTDETTYLVNDTAISSTVRTGYRNRNLLSLPTSTRVKDSSGTVVARAQASYDETSTYPLLTYGGTMVEWSNPSTNLRGLATTIGVWLNTTSSYVQTHAQYDQFGNVRSSWDANGNESQVAYSSSYNYAYPTSSTSAVPDPTPSPSPAHGSSTALTSGAVYNAATGRVTSTTDANSQTTSYTYDSINRLTVVTRPTGGGTTTFEYDDTPLSVHVRTLISLDSGRLTDSYQYVDGLGRPSRTFLNEGSTYLTTDTRYDTMSRVWKVSDPYRTTSLSAAINPNDFWTTNVYDDLGRVLTVTTSDGAVVSTEYSGSTSTPMGQVVKVTDQALKIRRSITDALGRLVRVDEPDNSSSIGSLGTLASPQQATLYSYDVLGSLTGVTQGSQTPRSFVYDSLGRLTSATNPESGTICYGTRVSGQCQADGYDNNGNLIKKTDARGVLATYSYDALNRNFAVTYSNDSANTPAITRTYDNPTSGANGKGRRWKTETSGSSASRTTVNSYDALGRPLSQSQQFYSSGSWSASYTVSATYDLLGSIATKTYPSGKQVAYNYDATGRLADKDGQNLAFTGNLGDGTSRNYSAGIVYDPAGRMTQEKFGTDTALYNKLAYNRRGQLAEMLVSTTGNDTSWNRGKLVNDYSDQCSGAGCNGTNNNGNLIKQSVYVPNNEQNSSSTSWNQQYTYDSLNRLTSVSEWTGGQSAAWKQSYLYDRWGNRRIDTGSSATFGSGINIKAFDVNQGNNRLSVPSGQSGTMTYDAAGNLTTDTYSGGAVSRSYDAENRMTSETQASSYVAGSYTYDADGRRVRRVVGSVETWQVYGLGGELLAEYARDAAASSPQKEYGYRNGQLLITASSSSNNNNSGLTGYWKFAENTGSTTADSSGNSHPGTLTSGATWAIGQDGWAGSFDGSNDYVQIGAQSSLSITTAGSFAAWIYPTGAGSNSTYGGTIVGKEGEYLVNRAANGHIQWAFANTNPGWAWHDTGATASLNTWTHVAVVYDTGTVKTYINGALVETFAGTGSVGRYDNGPYYDFRIGGRQESVQHFQGSIDEVRSYNKALNAGEISGLLGAPTNGLSGYWKFAENTGSTTADSSGNSHPGTLTSGATWAIGQDGWAGSFDGSNDYVQIGAQSSLSITTAGSFAAWIYPTGAGSNSTYGGTIVGKEGEYLVNRAANGHIQWAFANTNPGWAWHDTGATASLNTWTHVAVVYDTGTVKTYINGALVETFAGTGSVGRYDNGPYYDFRIGGRQESVQHFQGSIDEVRVYNRALTGSEVTSTHRATSGSSTEINWLVGDQLGTPRMVFDHTGALATTKRHDYLPFGEELTATQGARTTTQGYSVSDGERQKFTKYERDIETSLDYAQARYYSSLQGRFTSVDPLMASASIGDPQSFNRYSYVLNNPMNSTDPTGRCPKGKKCYTDTATNGEVTEYYDDEDGNTVLVGPTSSAQAPAMFPLVLSLAGVTTATDFQVVYRSATVLRGTVASSAPAAGAGPSIFGKLLGVIGVMLASETSIGCGQTRNTVSDGSGGCMHVDPEPDKSANPDPEDNKPDTSENETEGDKEKSRESKENYRPLSKKDIKELQDRGYDIHELKEGMGSPAHFDLYKDRNGNVYVMGKGGKGEAESTGVKLN